MRIETLLLNPSIPPNPTTTPLHIYPLMASADQPPNAAIFNEDEDLDDDDDDESSDHEDDDSASSALVPVGRHPPPLPPTSQVTIAVPGDPDPLLKPENTVAKKLDESRKLFQRLWTDEDEIELLQGFLDYTTQRCGPNGGSSQHHHDTTAFYDQIKSKFQLDFNKNQLVEKLRRLKKKYRNVINKSGNGKEYTFKSAHEQATFEISSKIWGNVPVAGNGSSAAAASRAAPAPIDEEDDDVNNPNFVDCQSPNLNGIDINTKTPPRSRKRNRTGAVKLEDKQQHTPTINLNNAQPAVAASPIASLPMGSGSVSGSGITGSLSSVIEETVKSCLSPIFKELLSNSMTSTSNNQNGMCCGNGFGLGRGPIPFGLGLSGDNNKLSSPIPFCFGAGIGGDKASNERWRKQQILELEVFSKRLELVQDQIREQLQDLRSMGN